MSLFTVHLLIFTFYSCFLTNISFTICTSRFYVFLWYNSYEKGERCLKKKITVLFCLVTLCIVTAVAVCYKLTSGDTSNVLENITTNTPYTTMQASEQPKMPSTTDDTTIHNVEIDTTPDSYTVLVNKEYGLPSDYIPEDLVVPNISFPFSYFDEKKQLRKVPAGALEELVAAAQSEGLIIKGVSGYRSYKRQQTLFNSYLRTQGVEHTERYSARPGYSEHQSGLSIDVSSASAGYDLTERFGNTAEGKWLEENCSKFGFIIRYPEGKESITGYAYEPWHIRYVGVELAKYLTENNLTLEEYYNYKPSATIAPGNSTNDYDLETAPTGTPYVPKYTKKPVYTAAPTVTPEPTMAPTATAKPTVKPTVKPTKKPTSKPVVTDKPEENKKPETSTTENSETEKPVRTKKPTKTEKPVQTETPAQKPTTSTDKVPVQGSGANNEASEEADSVE